MSEANLVGGGGRDPDIYSQTSIKRLPSGMSQLTA